MRLWYENSRGETIDLLNARAYVLTAATGIGSLPSNELTTKNTVMTDGELVSYRRRKTRPVVLTHEFQSDVRRARREFVRVLDQGSAGRLRYKDGDLDVFMDVEVEDCEVSNTDQVTKAVTSFLAPFPYWQDFEATSVTNRAVTGGWRFPFTFPVTFGVSSAGRSIRIDNDGDFAQGFTARFEFTGDASGPGISSSDGRAIYMRPDAAKNVFHDGESLEICTVSGSKGAWKVEADGTRTNVLSWLDHRSELFQLRIGANVLYPTADSGSESMSVTVELRGVRKAV